MKPSKILITGITGFIGSHIATALLEYNCEVIGLKRKKSDCWRCVDFINKITWVNTEDNYIEIIAALKPTIIIHCAWEGAGADKREDSNTQQENIVFLNSILQITCKVRIEKFIGLGSQAEYGFLNKPVDENAVLVPCSEYGKTKVMASQNVKSHCEDHSIDWYWLRLFSFYGPKEAPNWFIPYVITALIDKNKEIRLSACTQNYAYLYIADLVKYIIRLIEKEAVPCGIYNISGLRAIELKEIVLKIKKQFKNSTSVLQFGILPMRENQSVYLKGIMEKYHKNVGKVISTPFGIGIKETINYFKVRKNESI